MISVASICWSYILIFAVIAVTLYVLVKRCIRRYKYILPPGPKGWPIVGITTPLDYLSVLYHRDTYGDISYVKSFGYDIVILNSPDAIREAFLDSKFANVFSARPDSFSGKYFLQGDIFTQSIDDPHWKELRKLLHTLLKHYADGIQVTKDIVTNELKHLKSSLCDHQNCDIVIDGFLEESILNILCILCVGERYDYGHPILQSIREYLTRIDRLLDPAINFILLTFSFMRFCPLGIGKLAQDAQKSKDTVLQLLFYKCKNKNDPALTGRKGVVFELLKYQKSNNWLTDVNIDGLLQDIFGAGLLTTLENLRELFLLFLYFPDIQDKIRAEIVEAVGPKRTPDLCDRQNMPYTQAVILEVTRFSTVAPLAFLHALSNDTHFRKYILPKGFIVIANFYRVHHDKNVFPDPWKFQPERFLDDSGHLLEASHPKRRNLMPFGIGKRACVGEAFAKTRMFLFVTHLIQQFRFDPAGDLPSYDSRNFVRGITIGPKR